MSFDTTGLPDAPDGTAWVITTPDPIFQPWRFKHQVWVGLSDFKLRGEWRLYGTDPSAYAFRNADSIRKAADRALRIYHERQAQRERRAREQAKHASKYRRRAEREAAEAAAKQAIKDQVQQLNEPWVGTYPPKKL